VPTANHEKKPGVRVNSTHFTWASRFWAYIEHGARATARLVVPRPLRPFANKVYEGLVARRAPRLKRYDKASERVLNCCVAYNKFGGYCVPLDAYHYPVAQTILRGEVWEPKLVAFVRDHCGTGDVVHAGAFFGDGLPAIATALGPGAKLFAFEPNPDNYRCAAMTKLLNKLDNVELFEAGLGSQGGTAEFVSKSEGKTLGGQGWIVESKAATGLQNKTIVPIRIVTLDDTVPANRQVAIIHLDVEGYEQPAIRGAWATIKRCRPILIVEIYFTKEDCLIKTLGPLGYKKITEFGPNVVMQLV
jgi:FkbM family methyltransferase